MWIVTGDRRMADDELQCNCMLDHGVSIIYKFRMLLHVDIYNLHFIIALEPKYAGFNVVLRYNLLWGQMNATVGNLDIMGTGL